MNLNKTISEQLQSMLGQQPKLETKENPEYIDVNKSVEEMLASKFPISKDEKEDKKTSPQIHL